MRIPLIVCLATACAAGAGCTTPSAGTTREASAQVRATDRPECITPSRRHNNPQSLGTESKYDPCGDLGTTPIISSDGPLPTMRNGDADSDKDDDGGDPGS